MVSSVADVSVTDPVISPKRSRTCPEACPRASTCPDALSPASRTDTIACCISATAELASPSEVWVDSASLRTLLGHDREAPSGLAGAGGLDRRVQFEQVDLVGGPAKHDGDLSDLARRHLQRRRGARDRAGGRLDLLYGALGLLDRVGARVGRLGRPGRQLRRPRDVPGHLLGGRRHLLDGRGGLLCGRRELPGQLLQLPLGLDLCLALRLERREGFPRRARFGSARRPRRRGLRRT